MAVAMGTDDDVLFAISGTVMPPDEPQRAVARSQCRLHLPWDAVGHPVGVGGVEQREDETSLELLAMRLEIGRIAPFQNDDFARQARRRRRR